ncbi:MAG: site-2 protease family protein [Myxococcales bacterium]|jgi:Zn-dependent protease/predicted transcriptional regulator
MRGSYKIGRIAGIPIRIHISFLIVLPLFAYIFGSVFRQAAQAAGVPPQGLAIGPWLWGLALAVALFAAVLVHELAHSLYAIRKGGEVREITLLMLGGVSQLTKMPDGPKREAMMAFVGPLTSLVIGGLCLGIYALLGDVGSFNARFGLFYLGFLNVFLGVFNLLPAFPMDGGRILRAMLTGWLGKLRATRVAAAVGKGFAILLAVWGLLSLNIFVLLVALFVYVGAQAEAQDVVLHELLAKVHVGDVMSREVATVPADLTVAAASTLMAAERKASLVVVDDEQKVLGVLSIGEIERIPRDRRALITAREAMRPTPTLSPGDDAAKAVRVMGEQVLSFVPVIFEERIVGTISREDIARAIRLRALEQEEKRQRERPARHGWFGRRRAQHP